MDHHQIYQNFVIKAASTTGIIISGYASVYGISDKHNDIIEYGAFSDLPEISKIQLLWQHDQSKCIGSILSVSDNDRGLHIEAEINTDQEIIDLVVSSEVNGLSVGFNIQESYYNDQNQRVITKAELIEISIVNVPANDQAHIDEVSSIEGLNAALSKFDSLLSKTNNFFNETMR